MLGHALTPKQLAAIKARPAVDPPPCRSHDTQRASQLRTAVSFWTPGSYSTTYPGADLASRGGLPPRPRPPAARRPLLLAEAAAPWWRGDGHASPGAACPGSHL